MTLLGGTVEQWTTVNLQCEHLLKTIPDFAKARCEWKTHKSEEPRPTPADPIVEMRMMELGLTVMNTIDTNTNALDAAHHKATTKSRPTHYSNSSGSQWRIMCELGGVFDC